MNNPDEVESTEDVPAVRPRERCWPFPHLPEEPTEEERQALDPELRRALFGSPRGAFTITVVFSPFDGPAYARALQLARTATEYREVGTGAKKRSYARFTPDQVLVLRDLFEIVQRDEACEVLVGDQPVPYARELWLPLMWYLL